MISATVIAQAARHAQISARVSIDDPSIAVVVDDNGECRMFNNTAWERPSERGFLPWSPPPFPRSRIVAVVNPDGSWIEPTKEDT
jgi:hypothetical protein